jgi:hypothetical protein
MTLKTLVLVALIVVIFVGVPTFLFWSMVDHAKNAHRRERRGGGGNAMIELDRLVARPSVEHMVEAENKIERREDDQGGE